MQTFEMYYLSGQGPSEVWGAVATDDEPPLALVATQPYATLYSDTMRLSLSKLDAGAGDLAVDPDPDGLAYEWDRLQLVWRRYVPQGEDDSVAQTISEDFTAEINIKGRVIYGYNWFLKKTAMSPGVSKDGWWRLTFYSSEEFSPLNFLDTTMKFDPTSDGVEVMAEPSDGTYPREAVVDDFNDITYIDIYIEVSNAGGKRKGNGKGNQ